jgi:hypothetical protein
VLDYANDARGERGDDMVDRKQIGRRNVSI